MQIINLFGAPGSGKSTCASFLFYQLRLQHIDCELTGEFPKELRWEGRDIARKNHIFIFANHLYKIECLQKEAEVIISDSPLPLSIFYNDNPHIHEELSNLILKVNSTFSATNYLLIRDFPYSKVGRYQTEEESDDLNHKLRDFLTSNDIQFVELKSNIDSYKHILNEVINKFKL